MLRKIADVLKEVFWIKGPRKKARPSRPGRRKKIKKTIVKKKLVRKPLTVKPLKKPQPRAVKAKFQPETSLTELGVITHYFDRIKVCVVKLTQGTILIGDKLTIMGPRTKFVQKVWSMQIESRDVKVAKKGQLIGLKIDKVPVVGDKVYRA